MYPGLAVHSPSAAQAEQRLSTSKQSPLHSQEAKHVTFVSAAAACTVCCALAACRHIRRPAAM